MVIKYEVDPKLRKYLINKAFKETKEWKEGKKKRILLGYGGFFYPIILFVFLFLINLLRSYRIENALVNAMPYPLILFIVTGSIGIITLKTARFNAKFAPENRYADTAILDDEMILYSYMDDDDGYRYETTIKYKDIKQLKYLKKWHKLILHCTAIIKITNNGELIKKYRSYDDGTAKTFIPLYFNSSEDMVKRISEASGVDIEYVE
jgi:hypothetical protein